MDFCRGLWRLQGSLAVSRGIGDAHLKQWVVPNPETRILAIKPEFEFLILASDGLWDKVSFWSQLILFLLPCIRIEWRYDVFLFYNFSRLATRRL